MKRYIAKLLFHYAKKQVQDLFIDDLLYQIPEKVTKTGLEMAAKDRGQFNRWLYFEASSIFRRDPTDFGNIERRNGMLMLIKALLLSIGNAPKGVEEHPIVGETVAPPDEWMDAHKGVETFKKGKEEKKEDKE